MLKKITILEALNNCMTTIKEYIGLVADKKVDKVEGKCLTTNDLTDQLVENYNTAYNHSQEPHAPSNAQKNSDITKAEIEAKLTGNITTHTHNYAASNHNHNGVYTRKYAANIGDGSKTTINVAHNLGSEDVTVAVREVASKQLVMADVQIVDSNNIQILFASAPASNSYRVVVIG